MMALARIVPMLGNVSTELRHRGSLSLLHSDSKLAVLALARSELVPYVFYAFTIVPHFIWAESMLAEVM